MARKCGDKKIRGEEKHEEEREGMEKLYEREILGVRVRCSRAGGKLSSH